MIISEAAVVTLPSEVDVLRAVRIPQIGVPIKLQDLRPRYMERYWAAGDCFTWRTIKQSPIFRDLADFGPLKVSRPEVELIGDDLIVTIMGATEQATSAVEQLVFTPTNKKLITTKHFKSPIKSIVKSRLNTFDITVTDLNDEPISIIPNYSYRPLYTVVQIRDERFSFNRCLFLSDNDCHVVEALYKPHYKVMQNDYDEFQCPGYDKAIYYKTMEHHYARQKDTITAMAFFAKAASIVGDKFRNEEQGKSMPMHFGPNRFITAQDYAIGRC
jgi:hypothetical protein